MAAQQEDEQEKVQKDAEERNSPSGHIVYEAIYKEGKEELERPAAALAWSGLASGLSMGFSFLAMGLLSAALPSTKWAPLVVSLGMPLGFLIVILGRQQLFTENTLTIMLPLLRTRRGFGSVLKVWGVVLATNLIGALCFAFVLARTDVVDADVYRGLRDVAEQVAAPSFGAAFVRAVFAGWLIALVVWLLPFAESGRIAVIAALTYVIGLAHLTHAIVATVEGGFAVFAGDSSWSDFLRLSLAPALLGNILGGVTLVAALNHAQVVSGGTHDMKTA